MTRKSVVWRVVGSVVLFVVMMAVLAFVAYSSYQIGLGRGLMLSEEGLLTAPGYYAGYPVVFPRIGFGGFLLGVLFLFVVARMTRFLFFPAFYGRRFGYHHGSHMHGGHPGYWKRRYAGPWGGYPCGPFGDWEEEDADREDEKASKDGESVENK